MADALALETRQKLYAEIRKSPGLHFREIQRRTSMATGALQYHLEYLEKNDLLKSEKVDNTKRYYAMRVEHLPQEEKWMPLLRQDKMRHAALYLLTKKNASILQAARKLKLPYSSTAKLLDKMSDSGLLLKNKRRKEASYSIASPKEAAQLLIRYRSSFLDKLVDEFVNVWGELHQESKTI
ncbi:MAG: transcriptional regulator [Candidatus Diapherotrites archaeon]